MKDSARVNARLAARWARRAVERMRRRRHDIDEINVFPVPDGDTGTNMYDTVRSAYRAVEELTGTVTMHRVVDAMATGALRGARGNSGLILSVALRGVADALDGVAELDAHTFAGAMELAAARAEQAIATPVHGTMVTVLHEMAQKAREEADAGSDLLTQLEAVRKRSREALGETTGQLAVLSDAHVVDAGSTGIVEMFDLLYLTVAGRAPSSDGIRYAPAQGIEMHAEVGLELVFWCAEQKDKTREVTRALTKLGGTSIVVSWPKIHVHVADDETARSVLAACEPLGIVQLRMEDLSEEGGSRINVVGLASGMGVLMQAALTQAVAVNANVPGWADHVDELIEDGAHTIVSGVPSVTHELLTAAPVDTVLTAPGPVSLLAAMAVFDPEVEAQDCRDDMREAIEGTREGVITRPRPDGPFLSTDGETRAASESLSETVLSLVESLNHEGSAEIITIVTGRDVQSTGLVATVAQLKTQYPGVRVDVIEGDVPECIAAVGCE